MAEILGLKKLNRTLGKLAKEARAANVTVQTGFSQRYAVWVHEDLEANHPVGQAKFLEQPARELRSELGQIIVQVWNKTHNMEKALILAGIRLQREAQLRVPRDTTALRASAYTAVDSKADAAALQAFNKSERLRRASK